MKTTLFLLLVVLLSGSLLQAQVFQLPNGGFETWDGTDSDAEPTNWNGFSSAQCDLSGLAALGCNTATSTRHAKSGDSRPGSSGNYSCKIFATEISILGSNVVANGNLTTGQIRIGSTTATNPENYNITRTSNSDFRQPLNAKPDSIVFWAKFICPSSTQQARINAVIHDNYSYRDPEGSDGSASSHKTGVATLNFSRADEQWHRYSVPFDYDFPASAAEYILISFTTNKLAGEGSEDDFLYIDDVELVYNTLLSNLSVDGNTLSGFSPQVTDYFIPADCDVSPVVSASAQSQSAGVVINQAGGGTQATVVVSNGNRETVYTIHFDYLHTDYFSAEVCQGETYNQWGFNLGEQTVPGVFDHQLTVYESDACDSVRELTLTVHPAFIADTVSLMICNGAEYDFYGQILTGPGIYETVLSTVHGCDSTVTIDLTVGDYYRVALNAAICEGETYMDHGFHMNYPGSDSLMYVAANGCDSLVVLDLTVHPSYETEIYDTIIEGESYTGNGF